jgi:NAD-dependent dihydropyrimidine dehydrogenase PreA subunit
MKRDTNEYLPGALNMVTGLGVLLISFLLEGEELIIDRYTCYGCGLCVDVCPEDCVEMVLRNK